MHFIFIFFSLSTQSIALALASFVCLPTAADQLVVFCFVFFIFSSLVCCVARVFLFSFVYIFALIRPAIAVPDGRVFSLGLCALRFFSLLLLRLSVIV